ncbi:hypothetical protein [Nocardioides sp.]|uniref:hypothetical protein n=1 Tax=Nocardioides sp. TaxID=35761 RepID=UPI003565E039
MGHQGKRAGSRKAARSRRSLPALPAIPVPLLGLAAGVTLAVVAWGYLVKAAIDFGASARSGQSGAWGFLALASLGAVACLFIAMMLIARLFRHLGLGAATPSPTPPAENGDHPAPDSPTAATPTPPRLPGGRRAAR